MGTVFPRLPFRENGSTFPSSVTNQGMAGGHFSRTSVCGWLSSAAHRTLDCSMFLNVAPCAFQAAVALGGPEEGDETPEMTTNTQEEVR